MCIQDCLISIYFLFFPLFAFSSSLPPFSSFFILFVLVFPFFPIGVLNPEFYPWRYLINNTARAGSENAVEMTFGIIRVLFISIYTRIFSYFPLSCLYVLICFNIDVYLLLVIYLCWAWEKAVLSASLLSIFYYLYFCFYCTICLAKARSLFSIKYYCYCYHYRCYNDVRQWL